MGPSLNAHKAVAWLEDGEGPESWWGKAPLSLLFSLSPPCLDTKGQVWPGRELHCPSALKMV